MSTHTNSGKKILTKKQERELTTPPSEKITTAVKVDELKAAAESRAKQLPLPQRIIRAIKKVKTPFKEIIINSEYLEKRMALLVDGVLEKFDIERVGDDSLVGSIFKGKIQNLEPGLKAAFVDIAMPKNAFLHYWDILPAANDNSIEIVRDTRSEEQKRKKKRISLRDIPKLYPSGSNIVVQVTKAQIGTKGPRTTTNISLPGRFLVFMPYSGQCGISRKIANTKERQRLKKILQLLTIPEGMGVIIRTAGEGMNIRYFIRDLHILLKTWEEIQNKIEANDDPERLYEEPDLIELTVRDFLTEGIDRVLIDNKDDYEKIIRHVGRISPRSKSKIQLYEESIPIFERFNIDKQIDQTFQRKVSLPSGGEIVIEETEALVSIDVNTGSHKQKNGDSKNFILHVNLEAVAEIARQIRLRNIGGLIMVDFIDMKFPRDKRDVHKKMREEMAKDKARCQVLPISLLGILQMTRQRQEESMASSLYTGCPYCHERGSVKSPRTISVEIQRRLTNVIKRLQALAEYKGKKISLRVYCHPHVLERLRLEDEKYLIDIEEKYNVLLAFRADQNYHVENFKILDMETEKEIR